MKEITLPRTDGQKKNEVLYALIRLVKPKVVVETGVGAGVSSTVILRGLEKNGEGRLYSVDAGLKSFDGISLPENKPIGFLAPEDLRKRWTLILGFSREVLPSLLDKLKIIDFFFHDSEHTYQNMKFEYTVAYKHLSTGGILVSDNIEWNSAFDDFCNATKVQWAKLYTLGILRKFR
ncbi:MAG: class I SAM-dependent methyltransferase [Candidatus Jordarchaeales archaeon]